MGDSFRTYTDEEVEEFFDHFMKSSGHLASLRKLFALALSYNSSKIPDEVILALESTLCDKSISVGVRDVCSAILQEILPSNAISYEDLPQNLDDIKYSVPMMLLAVQSRHEHHKLAFLEILLQHLSSKRSDAKLKLKSLKLFAQLIASDNIDLIDVNIDIIAKMLKECLGPMSISSMTIKKREKIIEMDGSPATEMFTLLTLPENITDDYQLNIQAFSVLNQIWSTIFNGSHTSNAIDDLQTTIINYCLRIIDQSNRQPLKPEDSAFQQVALIEAISLLEKLSTKIVFMNTINIYEIMESLLKSHPVVEIMIPAVQLIIECNRYLRHDSNDKIDLIFNDCVTKALYNLCSSGEIILFLKNNLEYLNGLSPSPLRIWFPNLLKILAWYPVTFSEDFEELILTFLDENTAIEVFNSILDLPCLTLALIYKLESSSISKSELANVNKQELQIVLRKKVLLDDNYEVNGLYTTLRSIGNHPRVVATAGIIPNLLETCFEVLFMHFDEVLARKVLNAILKRSIDITEPHKVDELDKVFADAVLHIFLSFPQIIVDSRNEILQFFQLVQDPSRELCVNMIWIIGQYTSSKYADASTNLHLVYYDAIECFVYEHFVSLTSVVVSTTITTFIKISRRCREIYPRVKLFLDKVQQHMKTRKDWSVVGTELERGYMCLETEGSNRAMFDIEGFMRLAIAFTERRQETG